MSRSPFTVLDGGSSPVQPPTRPPAHPMAARRSPLLVLLSLLVTILIAGVIGLFAYSARMRIQKSYAESRMDVALDRAARGDQLLVEARRALVEPGPLAATLLASDVQTVDLRPAGLAAAASNGGAPPSGRLYWSRSNGLVAVVTGLPAQADGYVLRVGGPGAAPTMLGSLNGTGGGPLVAGFAASPAPGATVEIVPAQQAAGTSPLLTASLPR